MNKKLKILLWAVVGITIVSGAGYLIWNFIWGGGSLTDGGGTGEEGVVQISVPQALSTNNVFDYWVNEISGEIYYVNLDGDIYKIDSAGTEADTGSEATGNLHYLKPSSTGSLLLVAFGYPQNPTFAIHDINKKTWQALPAGTTAAAWDPASDNRLAYLKDNGTTGKLYLLTISNQKSAEVLKITQKDIDLEWSMPDLIYLKERPAYKAASSVWSYNLKSRQIKPVIRDEIGLMTKWDATSGNAFKWSGEALTIIDGSNRLLAAVDLKTLPLKCAFAESLAYCAAPRNQSAIKPDTFPDDYLKKNYDLFDNIYLLPLANFTNQSFIIPIDVYNYLIAGVSIIADRLETQNNRLLFINRLDNKLYSLEI